MKKIDKILYVALIALSLIALGLIVSIPTDSLNVSLIYEGF